MIVSSRLLSLALLAVGLAGLQRASAAPGDAAPAPAVPRIAAIFVENSAGSVLADKVGYFEALLAARLTSNGFSIISRDTAISALSSVSPGGPPTPADQILSSQSSALRLAQNLGADYILVVTLVSYGTDTRAFQGYGINTLNRITTLRATYSLCDAAHGGTLAGDVVTVSDTTPQTANFSENNGDLLNGLLDQASTDIATSFLQKVTPATLPTAAAPSQVPFSVICSMGDIVLPDVLAAPNNQYIIQPLAYTVEPLDVTVEVNGLALGSAPGNFTGPSGISKLRLSRQGFKTQEMTVNLSAGFNLRVALQMDDDGYARWQQSVAFLQGLKSDAKITDADAERVRGIAQMFRQSGLRLDQTSNVTVTATSLPPVQQVYPSLFSTPAPVWGGAPAPAAPAASAPPASQPAATAPAQ